MRGTFRESAGSRKTQHSSAEYFLSALHRHTNRVFNIFIDAPRAVQVAALCCGAVACAAGAVATVRRSREALEKQSNPLKALALEGETPSETMYRLDKEAGR